MRAIFEFVIAVNWAAIVFIVFSAAFVIYLSGLEKKSEKFKLEQAFSDADGRAYSPSLLYMACFPLGWAMIFYLLVAKEYTQASAVFAAMFTGYVTGSIWRGNTAAKERTDKIKVAAGIAEPVVIPAAPTGTVINNQTVVSKPAISGDAVGVWLPIENAPKDGTVLWLLIGGNSVAGSYTDGQWKTVSGEVIEPTHYALQQGAPK